MDVFLRSITLEFKLGFMNMQDKLEKSYVQSLFFINVVKLKVNSIGENSSHMKKVKRCTCQLFLMKC